LAAQKAKLEAAKAQELALRRKAEELESAKADLELEVARKLDSERARIAEEAGRRVAEQHELKQAEWDKQRQDLLKQVETLRQKAEQGSQQAQGEVFELSVEEALRDLFPQDVVTPVAKGVNGSDILHEVRSSNGRPCGKIAWELKRTKSWSAGWVQKLKDDQRADQADLAVIITHTMPEGVERIGQVDGVWVCDPKSAVGLASVLRASLQEVAMVRAMVGAQQGKAEQAMAYLSGTEFRGRVQTLVEAFAAMQDDLEAERRSLEKSMAKREKQITRAVTATAGFYGDLQGLLGLPEVQALTLD
jgi:hypothetical protein